MILLGNTPFIVVMVVHVIVTRFQEWRSTKSRIIVRIMTSQILVHRHVRDVAQHPRRHSLLLPQKHPFHSPRQHQLLPQRRCPLITLHRLLRQLQRWRPLMTLHRVRLPHPRQCLPMLRRRRRFLLLRCHQFNLPVAPMTLLGNTPTIAVVVMHVIATRFQEWGSTKSRIIVRITTSRTLVHRHVRDVPQQPRWHQLMHPRRHQLLPQQ